MPQTIDVTGLSEEAIHAVESVVELLRENQNHQHARRTSIFDLFGKAEVLRSHEDIAQQIREERDSWGES